jgi:hypothetical protein
MRVRVRKGVKRLGGTNHRCGLYFNPDMEQYAGKWLEVSSRGNNQFSDGRWLWHRDWLEMGNPLKVIAKETNDAIQELFDMTAIYCTKCGCILTAGETKSTADPIWNDHRVEGKRVCPECGERGVFYWCNSMAYPRSEDKESLIDTLLRSCHDESCHEPSRYCPRGHPRCAKRLNHATAIVWSLVQNPEVPYKALKNALEYARSQHGDL